MKDFRKKIGHIALILAAACILAATVPGHPGSGIVVDRLGQVYFLDTGSGLWKIDTQGGVTHLSPLRNHWLAIDENDAFTQARLPVDTGRDWVITAAGSKPTLLISTDFPLVIGRDGKLFYPSVRERNVRILQKAPQGVPATFVTLPPSVAGTSLGWINGLAAGTDGSLYYTEGNAVRRIFPQGRVSTVATVTALADRNVTPGSETRPYLRGLKIAPNGVLFVTDAADARVIKITPDGKITTLVQLEYPWAPTDVALFGEILYVLEFLHTPGDDRVEWMPRIRKVTPDGKSTVILNVDQMPGARPAKTAETATSNTYSAGFWDVLLRTIFFFLALFRP